MNYAEKAFTVSWIAITVSTFGNYLFSSIESKVNLCLTHDLSARNIMLEIIIAIKTSCSIMSHRKLDYIEIELSWPADRG